MNDILNLIISWIPAIASLGGIGTVAGVALKAVSDLKKQNDLGEIRDELKQLSRDNAELRKENRILIDRLTKINGYNGRRNER